MNAPEFSKLLWEVGACHDARYWAKGKTSDEVIDTCHRGDWLLWLAQNLEMELQPLTLAKGHCANTVRHLMTDERSIKAVDAAIAFGEGKISKEELRAAVAAAYAATVAVAAVAAAYAAAAAVAANAYAATVAANADAAYAAAVAAVAAKKANKQLTADICRTYIGDELKKLIKEREGKQ